MSFDSLAGPARARAAGAHTAGQRREGTQDQQLLWRVRQAVVAANNVGDPHVGIVHCDREGEQRGAVTRAITKSSWCPVLEPHGPTIGPRQGHRSSGTRRRIAEPGSSRGSPRQPAPRGPASRNGRLPRRPGRVGVAPGVDPPPARVASAAFVLAHRALIPVELKPPQRVQDLLDVSGTERSRWSPRSAARACRPSAWRAASCRGPLGHHRCGAPPSARGRSEGEALCVRLRASTSIAPPPPPLRTGCAVAGVAAAIATAGPGSLRTMNCSLGASTSTGLAARARAPSPR